MLNFNVLYTSFIPYPYCTDLSNLFYLPILVHVIINVTTLCLIKEPFKEYYMLIYLFIYYLEYSFIYLMYLPYRF